jgi:hypothetical protein
MDEVRKGRRKQRNGELHNLYSSSDIMKMIRIKGIRSAVHVARVRK